MNASNSNQISSPGVSASLLEAAGIQWLNRSEAAGRAGIDTCGIWIPYRGWDGNLLRAEGGPTFGRLAVDGPAEETAHPCGPGGRGHAYLPPGIDKMPPGRDLFLCDRELATLALTEIGVAAIGLQGIAGTISTDGRVAPELVEALERLTPGRVLLVGDSNTWLDPEFSRTAVCLREALPNV
jgi:hypothetical protein